MSTTDGLPASRRFRICAYRWGFDERLGSYRRLNFGTTVGSGVLDANWLSLRHHCRIAHCVVCGAWCVDYKLAVLRVRSLRHGAYCSIAGLRIVSIFVVQGSHYWIIFCRATLFRASEHRATLFRALERCATLFCVLKRRATVSSWCVKYCSSNLWQFKVCLARNLWQFKVCFARFSVRSISDWLPAVPRHFLTQRLCNRAPTYCHLVWLNHSSISFFFTLFYEKVGSSLVRRRRFPRRKVTNIPNVTPSVSTCAEVGWLCGLLQTLWTEYGTWNSGEWLWT